MIWGTKSCPLFHGDSRWPSNSDPAFRTNLMATVSFNDQSHDQPETGTVLCPDDSLSVLMLSIMASRWKIVLNLVDPVKDKSTWHNLTMLFVFSLISRWCLEPLFGTITQKTIPAWQRKVIAPASFRYFPRVGLSWPRVLAPYPWDPLSDGVKAEAEGVSNLEPWNPLNSEAFFMDGWTSFLIHTATHMHTYPTSQFESPDR